MVHISPDVERPLPKSSSQLLGKLEDYLKRTPHRAPKVFRRLRRHCDGAIANVTRAGVPAAAAADGAKPEDDEDGRVYNVDVARVRVSLEAFDLLLMIDALRGDDVIVGAELLPLLMGLMRQSASARGRARDAPPSTPPRPGAGGGNLLRCFGCYFTYRFLSSLDDLTFASQVDEIVAIVHEVVAVEVARIGRAGALPRESSCCKYAVRVLHQVIHFCRRTGHIVKKFKTIVDTLLMWLECVSRSSSTVRTSTTTVNERTQTKIIMAPLPVSSSTGASDDGDVAGGGGGGGGGAPEAEEEAEEEAVQALRDVAVLSSDMETARIAVVPVMDWLADERGENRWEEPVGAIVSSTILSSYVEQDQGYVLLQLLLEHLLAGGAPRAAGARAVSEADFVLRVMQALDDELSTPALLLLCKELVPVLDLGALGGGGDGPGAAPGAELDRRLAALLASAAVKVDSVAQLLQVIAVVMGRAAHIARRQRTSAALVEDAAEILRAAECLRHTAVGAMHAIVDAQADAGPGAEGAPAAEPRELPLALSSEICRCFLASTTLSLNTGGQHAQQAAVLRLLASCLDCLADAGAGRPPPPSFVSSILTPSKPAGRAGPRPRYVLSSEQLAMFLSSIFHRLPTSSDSPEFVVSVDECYRSLLSTHGADVVLPLALPMALAVQELALCGWDGGGQVGAPSAATSRLRLLMLSFSMLRHVGNRFQCSELPREAHPRSVRGVVDGEDGLRLASADEAGADGANHERVLSLFVTEFDNKGGVGSARDSVVNAVLSKYAISSSLSKASKQQLAGQFSPLSESWLVQAPAPAPEQDGAARGAEAAQEGAANGWADRAPLPSVREVLVDVMKMQPGRMPDAPAPSVDDVRREDAVRAIGAALSAAEIGVELQPAAGGERRSSFLDAVAY